MKLQQRIMSKAWRTKTKKTRQDIGSISAALSSPRQDMAEASSRFTSFDGFIDSFVSEQENQNTVRKTKRYVAFLTAFIQTKGETRSSMAEIPLAELRELLSEF